MWVVVSVCSSFFGSLVGRHGLVGPWPLKFFSFQGLHPWYCHGLIVWLTRCIGLFQITFQCSWTREEISLLHFVTSFSSWLTGVSSITLPNFNMHARFHSPKILLTMRCRGQIWRKKVLPCSPKSIILPGLCVQYSGLSSYCEWSICIASSKWLDLKDSISSWLSCFFFAS